MSATLQDALQCFSRAEFEQRLRKRVSEAGEDEVPAELQSRIAALLKRF